MIRLSERLRQLRQEKHLRQDRVAALVNVTKSAVSAWEGDMRQPLYDTLIRFADIYHVSQIIFWVVLMIARSICRG